MPWPAKKKFPCPAVIQRPLRSPVRPGSDRATNQIATAHEIIRSHTTHYHEVIIHKPRGKVSRANTNPRGANPRSRCAKHLQRPLPPLMAPRGHRQPLMAHRNCTARLEVLTSARLRSCGASISIPLDFSGGHPIQAKSEPANVPNWRHPYECWDHSRTCEQQQE